jgi:lysozyme family protein
MAKVNLTAALRRDYQELFDQCVILDSRTAEVEAILADITRNQARYAAVAGNLGVPWHFVAVIHNMESSLNFSKHLHNGDPLSARTRHVPAGRPQAGSPPFTWEESAVDALRLRKLDRWQDWSVAGTLYQLEGYNGWGYRLYHPQVLSPYLWSFSNHYRSGKYVADGTWSDTATSQQCGAAVLLRRLAEKAVIGFDGEVAATAAAVQPVMRYGPRKVVAEIEQLQVFLNRFPGIYVKVDGKAGEHTSDAFRQLTGHYLQGDPRA